MSFYFAQYTAFVPVIYMHMECVYLGYKILDLRHSCHSGNNQKYYWDGQYLKSRPTAGQTVKSW